MPAEPLFRTALAVDGFHLAYARRGPGVAQGAVVLLHGWPGDHTDWRQVVDLLDGAFDVVVPDLRGFGASDRHAVEPDGAYDAPSQARSIAGLIEELGLDRPTVGGYDIGSRIAQQLARDHPELVGRLVVSPPLPGTGERVLDPATAPELWYQGFHRSGLATELLDGDPRRVRAYLAHFWSHWSGPSFTPAAEKLDHLADAYGPPGAFAAATAWYRAGPGYVAAALAEQPPRPGDRLVVPTDVLWQEHDPLFPRAWSDRLDEFFVDVRLHYADGVGHFTPVEAPESFAELLRSR